VALISREHAVLDHAALFVRVSDCRMRIIHSTHPSSASLPPIMRLRPDADILRSSVASVVLVQPHQSISILPRGRADRVIRLWVKLDRRCARRERKKRKEHGSNDIGKPHRVDERVDRKRMEEGNKREG
jgi:hypothetical protein